ncbi:hypothetical protein GE061_010540 [Apolygus lucorum]|uniref:DUF243 domain-containing protein n=1 Tax=Apolygus lucorum TaxID=248454 RepID=A0A6A4K6C2_APOLU|nr:hypothetical protein GE061_010540 [Apolygus lucorum]
MKFFMILASVGAALARPEASIGGGYSSGGGFGNGIAVDSYAAPSGSGSGYPRARPQYGVPPVVQKYVYVHVPPPEPVYTKPKKPTPPPPPPQKNYKIVFIKAPTPPPPQVPDIPVIAPPAEQKTLIYVLVKKPEEAPEITIPTPAPTQPSKPEVYFIRYKTQKEEGYGPSGVPENIPSDSYDGPSPASPPSSYGVPSGSGPY